MEVSALNQRRLKVDRHQVSEPDRKPKPLGVKVVAHHDNNAVEVRLSSFKSTRSWTKLWKSLRTTTACDSQRWACKDFCVVGIGYFSPGRLVWVSALNCSNTTSSRSIIQLRDGSFSLNSKTGSP